MLLAPSPIVALKRAVAVADLEGPQAADIVDSLEREDYHVFHAIRAYLLRRLGRNANAAVAYDAAIAGTSNTVERHFL
jgi:RNA polymerase sigma-70 factor, ECF subfamily